MPTNDKITEIFCIADDFCKEFDQEFKSCPRTAKSVGIAPARCQTAK